MPFDIPDVPREHEKEPRASKRTVERLSDNFVPGDGPTDTGVMVIGEAPGADEDRELRPFVGRAGKLLNDTLADAGLLREKVYVTNVVKNRPPDNRRPTEQEIDAQFHLLVKEILLVKPTHVLLLGNTALHAMTLHTDGIMQRRGSIGLFKHMFPMREGEGLVYATLHPSAILHNPGNRGLFEADIRYFAKEYLASVQA
jgi:uracil-DNA glycosylase family 4